LKKQEKEGFGQMDGRQISQLNQLFCVEIESSPVLSLSLFLLIIVCCFLHLSFNTETQ
jgi:hypothetical protein